LRGQIHQNEERIAWDTSDDRLGVYGYYLRGQSSYLRFTPEHVLKARGIYRNGLDRYPNSALLRIELARTYLWMAMNQQGEWGTPAAQPGSGPNAEIEQAWHLAKEASLTSSPSRLETWLLHWLMAFLYQWHNNDFSRSVTEARATVELAPYDALSRNDLSWILANAGYAEEAIAWARSSLDDNPIGPSRYHANLAWAYYAAGRNQDAIEALRANSTEYPVLFAALQASLGEFEKARALVAAYVKSGGSDTVQKEDIVPLVEPAGTEYVGALRQIGLPED
jgi:tetratricopeptide (TPR) repeat protein